MKINKNRKEKTDCSTESVLELKPIGILHSSRTSKFETPHQPKIDLEECSVIELLEDASLSLALSDLESFSHIWVLWWFHRNKKHWKPKVLPPRGKAKRRGVLATRSPHRPNPIGLTAVRLLGISNNNIFIGSSDLLNGTPILDIKPYLPTVDAINEANSGWLTEIEADLEHPPKYRVEISNSANEKLSWLKKRDVDFLDRVIEILERDPTPHKTRRIIKMPNNKFRISCASWRVMFSVINERVIIEDVFSGHHLESLLSNSPQNILDFETHIEYYREWVSSSARGGKS